MTRLAPAAAAHARAYVDFAIGDAALLELMWQSLKAGDATAEIQAAAGRFFATVQSQVGAGMASGALVGPDLEHLTLLISATMQGIGAFASAGRTTPQQNAELIADAVERWRR